MKHSLRVTSDHEADILHPLIFYHPFHTIVIVLLIKICYKKSVLPKFCKNPGIKTISNNREVKLLKMTFLCY